MSSVRVEFLGQAGFRFSAANCVVLIDPYLSDRVERLEGPHLRRLRPSPYRPGMLADVTHVLISHAHIDHCDLDTLLPVASASPACRFVGPREVVSILREEGVSEERLITANTDRIHITDGFFVTPVPAAHKNIEIDRDGFLRYLGYVICVNGKNYLHTGDTCLHPLLIERARSLGPIDVALLPVNECNFYRDRAGIVGNMSIRDAFQFASEIDAKAMVPMHYDMFEPNQAYREEIEIIYQKSRPSFRLVFDPLEL